MKHIKTLIITSLLTLCFSSFAHAQLVAWDDNFSGASINENLSKVAVGTASVEPTQTGGQLVLDAGTNWAGRSIAHTGTSSTGATTFNGNDLYDFYKHEVQMTFDIASLAGITGTGNGKNRFYAVIGQPGTGDGGAGYHPHNHLDGPLVLQYGVGFTIDRFVESGNFQFRISTSNSGALTGNNISLSALPTSVTYKISGTSAIVELTAATFTSGDFDGESTASFTLADLSGISAFDTYRLAFASHNADGETETITTLDSFSVTAIPEPATSAMLVSALAFMLVLMRRNHR